jgi:hypothetical protein
MMTMRALHLVLSWLLVALVAAAAGVLRLVRMTEGRPLHLSETADVPRDEAPIVWPPL